MKLLDINLWTINKTDGIGERIQESRKWSTEHIKDRIIIFVYAIQFQILKFKYISRPN